MKYLSNKTVGRLTDIMLQIQKQKKENKGLKDTIFGIAILRSDLETIPDAIEMVKTIAEQSDDNYEIVIGVMGQELVDQIREVYHEIKEHI